MRELKFRAWDTVHKEWMNHPLDWIKNSEATDALEVVVMQYTGIEDNLGVEVYEGDIVAIYPIEKEQYAVVEQILFGWCFKHDGTATSYLSPELFRVVGNIYENPELLPTNANKGDK